MTVIGGTKKNILMSDRQSQKIAKKQGEWANSIHFTEGFISNYLFIIEVVP